MACYMSQYNFTERCIKYHKYSLNSLVFFFVFFFLSEPHFLSNSHNDVPQKALRIEFNVPHSWHRVCLSVISPIRRGDPAGIWCQNDEFHSTVKPVLRDHPRKEQKVLFKTGDHLSKVNLHYILVQGTQERCLLEAGDLLIELTT